MMRMDAKIIFELESSFCLKYFLLLMTSQISLLEGAIANFGVTGSKKAFFFFFSFLMVGFCWKEDIF